MLLFQIILFSKILAINGDLYTSNYKLCELLQLELHNLYEIELKIPESTKFERARYILKFIRSFVPRHIFNKDNYNISDCMYENSALNRFITNPINSYMIIKRHAYYWPEFVEEMRKFSEKTAEKIDKMFFHPNEEEIEGVIDAIYRLGEFYDLEKEYFSTGTLSAIWIEESLRHSHVPVPLDLNDIFKIGLLAFNYENYHSCVSWLRYGLNMLKTLKQWNKNVVLDILDYLSWSEYEIGLSGEAFEHCRILVDIKPNDSRMIANLDLFNKTRWTSVKEKSKQEYVLDLLMEHQSVTQLREQFNSYKEDESNIQRLIEESLSKIVCKSGYLWDLDIINSEGTKCYLKNGNNLYGKLTKIDVEKIYNDPDVILFRNIISNDDIEYIKNLAKDDLRTATVNNVISGKSEPAKYRIARSAWLDTDVDPIIKKLMHRIKVATGLTLKSAEKLQVANYGMGGYYDLHYDFSRKETLGYNHSIFRSDGNRMATFMIYMSDMPIAGKTAFPKLGIGVSPSKGDAIFWYNLHPDGSGDARTKPIGCPVALGTKWVANLWIRTLGEELSRPCNLIAQDGI